MSLNAADLVESLLTEEIDLCFNVAFCRTFINAIFFNKFPTVQNNYVRFNITTRFFCSAANASVCYRIVLLCRCYVLRLSVRATCFIVIAITQIKFAHAD